MIVGEFSSPICLPVLWQGPFLKNNDLANFAVISPQLTLNRLFFGH